MNESKQLSEEEERRAISLHEQSIVILMHDHLPIAGDIPKMRMGGVTAKVYNLICDVEISGNFRATANQYEGWAKRALVEIDQAITEIEADDNVLLALTAGDIEKAKREGKIAILFGSEGGKLLEGELSLQTTTHDFVLAQTPTFRLSSLRIETTTSSYRCGTFIVLA